MNRHGLRRVTTTCWALVLLTCLLVASPAGAINPGPFGIEQMMTESGTYSFGSAVSVSGNTAVVGMAINGPSVVYVYVRSGDTWALQQAITSPAAPSQDRFGQAVAIDGNTMIVGAFEDDEAATNAGRAYVYTRSGTTWSLQDELVATGAAASDYFGLSVAVSGDVAVVGAPNRDNGVVPNLGAVFVFRRTGSVWAQEQVLTATDGVADDQLGYAVDIDGTTVVAGAPYAESAVPTTDVGRVYVFTDGPTGWEQQGGGLQPTTFAYANHGIQVSVSGNTLLMGAQNRYPRVYTRSAGVWAHQQSLAPSSINDGDHAGAAVDLYGDTAVVGSPGLTVGGRLNNGGAFVFTRSGTTWTEAKALTASDGATDDRFGMAVATNGTCALVGAPWESANLGKAYFYSTLAPPPPPVILSPIYRFFNRLTGTHLYTADGAEAAHIRATWPTTMRDEGVGYYVDLVSDTQPLYRLFNLQTGTHFYTADPAERAHVMATWPTMFRDEGYAYSVSLFPSGTKATVYRFYNLQTKTHFYTATEAEKDYVRATWPTTMRLEGPAFYVGQ